MRLPNAKISFSDYLFPGEGASEVLSSFKELLDITISEINVQKDFEIQGGKIRVMFFIYSVNLQSSFKIAFQILWSFIQSPLLA